MTRQRTVRLRGALFSDPAARELMNDATAREPADLAQARLTLAARWLQAAASALSTAGACPPTTSAPNAKLPAAVPRTRILYVPAAGSGMTTMLSCLPLCP